MNEDRIKGQWKQLAGKLKEKWGKLTDNDLQRADGSSEYACTRRTRFLRGSSVATMRR